MFLNAEMAITAGKHLGKSTKISYIMENKEVYQRIQTSNNPLRFECSYEKCTALPMHGKENSSVTFQGRLDRTSFYNWTLKERDLR